MEQSKKKSLYFMPFLEIEETIEYEGIRLRKNKREFENMMPEVFKNHEGIFIELVDYFQSGDYFDDSLRIKIYDSIEILKFAYYIINIPTGNGYPGFISDSTFEIYTIIEQNKGKSFEHKIPLTNGVSRFLMNLNDYYQHQYILGSNHCIKITENSLFYIKYIYQNCINDENKLSVIKLYNKCLRITDINDCFDKIIFARASIETLIKIKGQPLTKRNYIESFIDKIKNFLANHNDINSELLDFYQNHVITNNGLDKSEENLNNYLKALTGARHNLVHENRINVEFMSVEVYIAWFPLFFLQTFFEEKLTKKDIPRLILFLKLLQLDFKQWNKKDAKNFSRMTCLEVYAQYTRSITVQLDNETPSKYISTYLKGFNNYYKN